MSYIINFVCHTQMSKYMYKIRYLFIKKLYFGFFKNIYTYKYIYELCMPLWDKCRKIFWQKDISFRFVQNHPLDCKLTKSVKTRSKSNQSKTTKKQLKIE